MHMLSLIRDAVGQYFEENGLNDILGSFSHARSRETADITELQHIPNLTELLQQKYDAGFAACFGLLSGPEIGEATPDFPSTILDKGKGKAVDNDDQIDYDQALFDEILTEDIYKE